MPMKNVLICGGAGFIGSHLCKTLLGKGSHVICIDDFSTGNYGNILSLESNSDFEIMEHDIIFPLVLKDIDEIYNLACPASPVHYQCNPVHTTKTSVLGTLNLLDLARLNHCKYLQASTSEVYGDPQMHPQVETYWGNVNPNGIRSCYDEGKRCAESLCMDYYRQYGLPVKIIRIFNTYGPNMAFNDGRVISNFIIQALKGQNITIYGNGTQTRSFQYIDDLIEGMLRMMNTRDSFTGPVNLGNPEECKIKDLAMKVRELVHSDSKIVFEDLPLDDPKKRRADITLARNMLDWCPRISLKEGLKFTIEYYKQVLLTMSNHETCCHYIST